MKLSASIISTLLLVSAQLLITSYAYAAVVEPTGRDTSVSVNYDLSSSPSNFNIWNHESGGFNPDNPSLWGRNNWRCLSNTSPSTGQCKSGEAKNSQGDWGAGGTTSIPTLFIEKRTGLQAVINLEGYHAGENGKFQVTSADSAGSGSEQFLSVYITSAELKKLPVGGIWEGTLALDLWQWSPGKNLARWTAHITLNATDNNNQQIYLPEFGEAAPRVDLNMRPLPGTGGNQTQMNGAATLDMCLYDGYGSNSTSFTLKFDDQQQGTIQRNSGYFSIYSDHGDVNLDSGRIDYYVKMQAPDGKYVSVKRGEDLVIPDIQTAHVRPVHLPGIPQAVLCVPAPLQLSTKTLDINSKQAGHYTGHLIVTFTPQL
ncbi:MULTISPECIES: CfaE/CblD family pilus tip adhesin [Rahnella]|uniref:CfaE/CblD family pilus tip adhesin n=1 Tax=Rahnella TaxID=34037 RepID=UPI000BB1D62C|nr:MULTISPECIES: CfaE/CblD family pilus tip adhesin [Rahnella]PBI81983.1 pilus assembly protein CblD [Rahnella victoriana]TBX32412.1 pilus assembly protein CblD [Rahnella victoriana]TDS86275.1 CblD-like pilus biogenesis initiator [Rahnella sp. BIGb0236]UHM91404.1 pilus assembly protein CblD [Rahnella victoriana]